MPKEPVPWHAGRWYGAIERLATTVPLSLASPETTAVGATPRLLPTEAVPPRRIHAGTTNSLVPTFMVSQHTGRRKGRERS